MKLLIILLMGALLGSTAVAGDADLAALRTKFKTAIERVTQPIEKVYASELTKLRDDRLSKKMLAEANEIDAELTKYAAVLVTTTVAPAGPTTTTGRSARAEIAASDPNGYKIGSVKAGDSVTLQYREGKWKSWGMYATLSPDDVPGESDKCKVVISKAAVKGGPPGEVIVLVPGGTATTPFTYVFTADCDAVVRIADAGNPKAPGSVIYSCSIKRK